MLKTIFESKLHSDESPVKSPDESPNKPPTASGTRTSTFKSMFRDISDTFERMTEQDFIKWQTDRGVYELNKSTAVDPGRAQEFLDSYEGYASWEDGRTK